MSTTNDPEGIELDAIDDMDVDDVSAGHVQRKIKISNTREKMKTVVIWLLQGKLDGVANAKPTDEELFNHLAANGDIMIWTLCAYFQKLYDIAVADTVHFEVVPTMDTYLPTIGSLPTVKANNVPETASRRLMALFLAFISLAKGNAAVVTPGGVRGPNFENEAVFRRYKAMVAGKNLPPAQEAEGLLRNIPAGGLEAGGAMIWMNEKIAKKAIAWILEANPKSEADKALVAQMRLVYGGAEMTFAKTATEFMAQCDTHLKIMPHVVSDGERYLTVRKEMQARHGEHYLHLRLLKHTDAEKLAPRAFPYLAGAVTYWVNRRHAAVAGPNVLIAPLNIRVDGYTLAELDEANRTKIENELKDDKARELPEEYAKMARLKRQIVPKGYSSGNTQGLNQFQAFLLQALQGNLGNVPTAPP